MNTCPRCAATIPESAPRCQFCGEEFSAFARPVPRIHEPHVHRAHFDWIVIAYYGVAWLWAAQGAYDIVVALGFEGSGYLAGIGVLNAAIGLGLVFRVDIVRRFILYLCYVRVFFGLVPLIAGAFGLFESDFNGWPQIFAGVSQILTGLLMIFVISKSE